MNMAGKNGLACTTPHAEIDGDIDIYPLPHLKVKRDLIGDLDGLYKQYQSIEPWLKITQQNRQQKFISLKKIEQNLMVLTNALCVLVVLHLVQVIGGMEINTWALRFYFKLIDGSLIVETKKEKQD